MSTACVWMLVVSVLLFATYLKVFLPFFSSGSNSSSQVKFWVSPNVAKNTKVKLAMVSGFVMVLRAARDPFPPAGNPTRSLPAPSIKGKDVLAESGIWFRPPPLS